MACQRRVRLINWLEKAGLSFRFRLLPKLPSRSARSGFTLAELLVCMLILGEIATFTIPKILTAQQNQKYNARAHETAAMIAAAYQQAQLAGTVTANTSIGDLTQYFNYVSAAPAVSRDGWSSYPGTSACGAQKCLLLHNGGILYYNMGGSEGFGGTGALNAIWINYDPDSTVSDPTSGISFILYYNGRITSTPYLLPGSSNAWGGISGGPDPSWFSW